MSNINKMTLDAVKSAYEREAADDFVRLIELQFGDAPEIHRYSAKAVEQMVDVDGYGVEDDFGVPIMGMYHGEHFYAFLPFDLPGLAYEDEKAPDASISVEGLSSVIIPLIRPTTGKIRCSLILVHTSDKDIEQERIDGLVLDGITGDMDSDTISGTLTLDMLTSVGYPADIYTPDRFPAMF